MSSLEIRIVDHQPFPMASMWYEAQWTSIILHWSGLNVCFKYNSMPPVIFKKLTWADVKDPLTNFRVSIPGWAALQRIFWTWPKHVARPTQLQKKILPLHSWRPFDYKSHIECTSPSRSKIVYIYIYMHSQSVNKQLIGISFWKWNHWWGT